MLSKILEQSLTEIEQQAIISYAKRDEKEKYRHDGLPYPAAYTTFQESDCEKVGMTLGESRNLFIKLKKLGYGDFKVYNDMTEISVDIDTGDFTDLGTVQTWMFEFKENLYRYDILIPILDELLK